MPADPAEPNPPPVAAPRHPLHAALHQRTAHLSPTTRALIWSMSAGLLFSVLNALARSLTLHLHPMQSQFLRYLFGLLVMLPLVWRAGLAAYRPKRIGGQFTRGAVHTLGLVLWFSALPKIPLADMTAIGFTGPIFIMIGAFLFLGEPMRWERWVATAVGFAGMLVVLGPKFSGSGGWLAPGDAGLGAGVRGLVPADQGAHAHRDHRGHRVLAGADGHAVQPAAGAAGVAVAHGLQWAGFAVCGLLGSLGHYCLTRSYRHADISATQSVKFLDLVWASLLGLIVFADVPLPSTLLGGALISAATLWLARRESRALARLDNEP
jgi:drug/metabolite transporter (DMT)-like permease